LPLLLLGCALCNTCFPVIFDYFEKTDIIVDLIDMVGQGSFFAVSVISMAANCCLEIMSEYLASLDQLVEASFGIGVLCIDTSGKLLKQRSGITHQCFGTFS
jgi:hypothetical protein